MKDNIMSQSAGLGGGVAVQTLRNMKSSGRSAETFQFIFGPDHFPSADDV